MPKFQIKLIHIINIDSSLEDDNEVYSHIVDNISFSPLEDSEEVTILESETPDISVERLTDEL